MTEERSVDGGEVLVWGTIVTSLLRQEVSKKN